MSHNQLATLGSPTAHEVWAFGTVPTNVRIRDALYQRLGQDRALIGLASIFPSGSAVGEIERSFAEMAEESVDFDQEAAFAKVCEEIVGKVVAEVERLDAVPPAEAPKFSTLISWFESLPVERQAILRNDKWMLAEAAFAAARL